MSSISSGNYSSYKPLQNFANSLGQDILRSSSTVISTGLAPALINDVALGVKPEKSIYNNLYNSFFNWFLTDLIIAQSIRGFKKVALLNKVPSDFINSTLSLPIHTIMKLLCFDKNSTVQLYETKEKEADEIIIAEEMAQRPIKDFLESLSVNLKEKFSGSVNQILKSGFGVTENKINYYHFFSVSSLLLGLASFALPHNTRSIGFEDAKTVPATIRSSTNYFLATINNSIFTSIPLHLKGMSFPKVFSYNIRKRAIPRF